MENFQVAFHVLISHVRETFLGKLILDCVSCMVLPEYFQNRSQDFVGTGGRGCLRSPCSLQRTTYTTGLSHQREVELNFGGLFLKTSSEMHVQGYFQWLQQWFSSGLVVVQQWSTSGLLEVYQWSASGQQVVTKRSPSGHQAVTKWSTCGMVVPQNTKDCHILPLMVLMLLYIYKFKCSKAISGSDGTGSLNAPQL